MAILTIESKNENFSWVIFKSPLTQEDKGIPFEKPFRKGMLYGWYPSQTEFRVLFEQEGGDHSFYKNENNNYLNADKIFCSYAYCGMITNMLDATIKKIHEKDIVSENKVILNTIWIPNFHIARSFKNHLQSIDVDLEQLGSKLYRVSFSGKTTLYYLLNAVMVFCLMQALEDRRVFVDLTESTINKYAQCLKAIDAPYYLIYIFLSRCIPDYNLFKKTSTALAKDNWKLYYGDTQKQRFNAIKKHLNGGKILHDIGCGELYYSTRFSADYNNIVAWESSDSIVERNKKYIVKKGLLNIQLNGEFNLNNLSDIDIECDLLITEMLEHISLQSAEKILAELARRDFATLIITLPNTTFNKHYLLDGQFRHDDHKWEPTYEDSVDLINKHFKEHHIKIEKIGDMVDGESVTTLFVIKK